MTPTWRTLAGRPWRVVESQHRVATTRLTDSLEEQEVLERLIDGAKPPVPRGPEFAGLHYLLSTPFRYPPLRHGSRFAARHEPSPWYGSAVLRTALAEVAYYRLVFLEGTAAGLGRLEVDLTAFRVPVRTRKGVDLTGVAEVSSPTSYAVSQETGRTLREQGAEALRYRSARDARGGTNLCLFTPRAFAARAPQDAETWFCAAQGARVDFLRRDILASRSFSFRREEFLVEGRLPAPAP